MRTQPRKNECKKLQGRFRSQNGDGVTPGGTLHMLKLEKTKLFVYKELVNKMEIK